MRSPSLLAGSLYDGEGQLLTPSHAIKKGVRYRYYVSRPLISDARANAVEGLRIPAGEIEQLVVMRIGQFFSEPARIAEILSQQVETAAQQRRLLRRAAELGANWPMFTATQLRPIIAAMIRHIVVRTDRVDIQLLPSRVTAVLRNDSSSGPIPAAGTEVQEQPVVLSVPAQFKRLGLGIRMLVDGQVLPGQASKADPKLVKLIARAHLLSNKLAESSHETLANVAHGAGFTSSYFTRVLRLTYLAPDITRAILEGRHPCDLTAQKLLAHSRLPLSWPEQRRLLGLG